MNEELAERLLELSVFASLYENPLFQAFVSALKAEGVSASRQACAKFAALLYAAGKDDWNAALSEMVLQAPTCLSVQAAKERELTNLMLDAGMKELEVLSKAASLKLEDICENHEGLAMWKAYPCDLQADYLARLMEIGHFGTGVFARARSFRLSDHEGKPVLEPVIHPDPVSLESLYGYGDERKRVIENTTALLEGWPSENVLLYGDAGTGKSATVKAVVNAFCDKGLRLVEITKSQLHHLPWLLDQIALQPLKFIIFADDLSFQEDDDQYAALKAVLEGSSSTCCQNARIYATSNRTHLVKETFSAREGDDVHRSDTMQETLSLSDRFGLKVLFSKPGRKDYLLQVAQIAKEMGLDPHDPALAAAAERFALEKSGRSPRTARQCVSLVKQKKEIENAQS
jgi:hypothetical protein